MASSNRLCNATPFELEWNFHAGQEIVLAPDGYVELEDPIMCEQIRPGAPGAEPVRMEMEEMGIFVRDPSLPYEVQVMEALERCIKLKKRRYEEAEASTRRRISTQGAYTEESLRSMLEQDGFERLRQDAEKLENRLKQYKKLVDPNIAKRAKRQQYDPERTIFVMDPPREFESKIAMQVFLNENPEIAGKHEKYMAALQAQEELKAAAVEPQSPKQARASKEA